jgi:hypothetical protein
VTDEATPKQVIVYTTINAKEPFTDWLNDLVGSYHFSAAKAISAYTPEAMGNCSSFGSCNLTPFGIHHHHDG